MQKQSTSLVRHFRGGVYFVITQGKHTETQEDYVVYAGTGVGGSEGIHVRPAEMFNGPYSCARCESTWPRFTRIGEPKAVVCDCPPFEECTSCNGKGNIPDSMVGGFRSCGNCGGAGTVDLPVHTSCIKCGGTMTGDGYTQPLVCENRDPLNDVEPDSGPWYCGVYDRRVSLAKKKNRKGLTDEEQEEFDLLQHRFFDAQQSLPLTYSKDQIDEIEDRLCGDDKS